MIKTNILCRLSLVSLVYCAPALAGPDMAVLQESKPLVTRAGAWHTWQDRIHLTAEQTKLPLLLTFANGADGRPKATDLKVELDRKPLASFGNFNGGNQFTIDLTGKLSAGNTALTVQGFGPSGAWMKWKLFIQRPIITSVQPAAISMMDTVTIKGRNFSTDSRHLKIQVGKKHANPLSSKEDEVKFKLPAQVAGGRQDLIVSSAAVPSAPFPVVVRANPHISGVNMLSSPPHQPVIIKGSGFSSVPSENIVTFGTLKAEVVSATESSITCLIPEMHFPDWHVPIKVTTNGLPSKVNVFINVDVRVIENEGIPMH